MAETQHQAPEQQRVKPRRSRTSTWALAVLLVIALAGSGFWFVQYRKAVNNNPVTRQKHLVAQLGKIIEMPKEQPVITTVLDRAKLTNKVLASQAQNGDLLFIFAQSKRLVLYRPSEGKVVDMLTIQT